MKRRVQKSQSKSSLYFCFGGAYCLLFAHWQWIGKVEEVDIVDEVKKLTVFMGNPYTN